MKTPCLIDALFGKTKRSILVLLFGHDDEAFHLRKILRLADISPGAGQRELKKLADAGLITRSVKENQVLFQANPHCPIFPEIKMLVTKTAGAADVLRAALDPLIKRISVVLIYGSLARGSAGNESDLDLLIVGEVRFEEIVNALHPVQDRLRREINPLVMSSREFRRRLSQGDHLIREIMKSPFIPILGDPHDFGRMEKERMARRTLEPPPRDQSSLQAYRAGSEGLSK